MKSKPSVSVRSKILAGLLFPVLLFIISSLYVYESLEFSLATTQDMVASQDVITKAHELDKLLTHMEIIEHGLTETRDMHYFIPFDDLSRDWIEKVAILEELLDNKPEQRLRVEKIKSSTKQWIDSVTIPVNEIERKQRTEGTSTEDDTRQFERQGKELIDQAHSSIVALIHTERAILKTRAEEAERSTNTTLHITTLFFPLLALIGCLVAIFVLFKAVFKPLTLLREAIQQIKSGNLTVELENNSEDDLGQFNQAFNGMTRSLRASQREAHLAHQEAHEAQLELTKKAEELELANKYRSQFLTNMSHEIRTPVNGVIGMLSLLERCKLDERAKHYSHLANESAKALLTVIDDILDFSKIESGKLEIENTDFNLERLISDFCHSISHRAQGKGLELILDLAELSDTNVIGDPARIRQILSNLTHNAIKFTDEGEITISAYLKDEGGDNLMFQCSVADTGIGIPAEKISQLFNSFTQEDSSTTRKHGGSGLGLTIVHQLCKLMSGHIYAGSLKDRGSEFTFSIPLKRAEAAKTQNQTLYPLIQRAIVIAPNRSIQSISEKQFKCFDIDVEVFSHPRNFINTYSSQEMMPVDLILMERFPASDEKSLQTFIQRTPSISQVKVIAMVKIADLHKKVEYEALHFDKALPKPISASDLFDTINSLFGGTSNNPPTAQSSGESRPHHTSAKRKRILVVEDNAYNQEVALGILEELDIDSGLATNGVEAIEQLKLAQDREPFDLVFMDCQMPELDGYEATRRIRSITDASLDAEIPIIAMTANAMHGDRERCLGAGMDDYMAKPVSYQLVSDKLEQWLGRNKTKVLANQDNERNRRHVVSTLWNQELLLSRMRYRTKRMNSLIEMFVETAPGHLSELNESAQKNDLKSVAKQAHKLKGIYLNIASTELSQLASKLENEATSRKAKATLQTVLEMTGLQQQLIKQLKVSLNSETLDTQEPKQSSQFLG